MAERFGVKVRRVELKGYRLLALAEGGAKAWKRRALTYFLRALVRREVKLRAL